ncbi:MAG: YtxH domain-containing protein [Muribaculaceae bacterium]|nr:YtxH domain-containing protein [Muribaculaceae bacterium]
MCNKAYPIYAFIGGAIVGACSALLFAPEKGSKVRGEIVDVLRKKGLLKKQSKVDEVIDELKEIVENAGK